MTLACAEGLHVETRERIVRYDIEAAPRGERPEALAGSQDRQRTVQPARVEKVDDRLSVSRAHTQEVTTERRGGGRSRTRTEDVLRVKQVLYQLS